jgi:hypothetical protein
MCVALYLLLQGRGQPGALRDIRDAAVSLHAIKKTHRKRKRGSEVIRGVRERERERKRKKERERERETHLSPVTVGLRKLRLAVGIISRLLSSPTRAPVIYAEPASRKLDVEMIIT